MTNTSRNLGTGWESEIVSALQRYVNTNDGFTGQRWPYVERRALQGALDKGDIAGIPGVMIEAKAEKKIDLGGYVKEVETQTKNAAADVGVAWIKRRGKAKAEDGYVVMVGSMFMQLLAGAGY